jgi:hypothetical protein
MKIMSILILMFVATLALADTSGQFRYEIPQPDFLSNDWDGDGEINSVDTDDDDDGILDVNDSTPFGPVASSETGEEELPVPEIPAQNLMTYNVVENGTGATYSADSTYALDNICGLFDNNGYNVGANGYDVSGTYSSGQCSRGIWAPSIHTSYTGGWIQIDNPIQAPIFAVDMVPYYSIDRQIEQLKISYSTNNGSSYIEHQTIVTGAEPVASDYDGPGNVFVVLDTPIPANVTNILLNYIPADNVIGDFIEMEEIRILSSEEYRL